MDALQRHFSEWKRGQEKKLSDQQRAEASGTAAWLAALARSKGEIGTSINALRTDALGKIQRLDVEVAQARAQLVNEQRLIQNEHRADETRINAQVRTGLATLEREQRNVLRADTANETRLTRGDIAETRADVSLLTRKTNAMIADLSNQVRAAEQKQRVDDTQQQMLINSQRNKQLAWWNQDQRYAAALLARVERVQHSLDSRREVAHLSEARAVASVITSLERSLAQLNATIKTAMGSTATYMSSTMGRQVATLEGQLRAVRAKLQAGINKQDSDLAAIARTQLAKANALKTRMERLYRQLESIRTYATARQKDVEQKLGTTQTYFSDSITRWHAAREATHSRIRDNTKRQFDSARNTYTAQVNAQHASLENVAKSYVVRARNKLTALVRSLAAGITSLQAQMEQVKNSEAYKQGLLKTRIEQESDRRSTVVTLENRVKVEWEAAAAAVAAFDRNQSAAHHETVTIMEAAENALSMNEGLDQMAAALSRTLQTIKLSLSNLEADEAEKHQALNSQTASDSAAVAAAQQRLQSELERLNQTLLNDINTRTEAHVATDSSIHALHIRLDDSNATLHRLKARFQAAINSGSPLGPPLSGSPAPAPPPPPPAEAAEAAEPVVSTEMPPTSVSMLDPSTGKGLLNAHCATWRDQRDSKSVTDQKRFMAKCMAQDCEQSLESPSTGSCRWLDDNGLCYNNNAAQQWCTENAPNVYCHDGGANWALAPVGTVVEGATQWLPRDSVAVANPAAWDDPTFSCSCMKDCTCSSSSCYCVAGSAAVPVGFNEDYAGRNKYSNSGKEGKCACSCGGQGS